MTVPDNILATIDNYTNAEKENLDLVSESGEIVGEIVDAENRLIYVIKDGDDLRMQYAVETDVVFSNLSGDIEEIVETFDE